MAEKALLSIAEYSSAIDSAWKTCAKSFAERISLPCIHVYATGLTVALLATLNALRDAGCEVIVMHYDREKGEYYPQRIA